MITNLKKELLKAKEDKYAIPHFNINNLEWARYILEACEEKRSPVILGVSEGSIKYMGGAKTIYNMVIGLMEDLNITIPFSLHLDHGSKEYCLKAIDAGFTSVMIDASKYTLQENIEITKQVVDYAVKKNVLVEAEIGHIGGVEDNISANILYAEVLDCEELVKQTNIDILAPALGSVHGIYKGEPKLDFIRMKEISENTKLPLVLHGASGIPDYQIKQAIECGISKINIDTDLKMAWAYDMKKFIQENPNVYDPRKVIKSGEIAIKKVVAEKVNLLNSYMKV